MLIILLAYFAVKALVVLFFSLIISSAVEPVVNTLQKGGVPRGLSAIFLYLLAVATVATALYLIIPPVVVELRNFLDHLENLTPQLSLYFSPEIFEELRSSLSVSLDSLTMLLESGGSVFNLLGSLIGGVAVLLATTIVTFYILVNENGVTEFIRAVTPAAYEDYLINLWLRVKKKLGRWLQTQLSLSILIGLLSFGALRLLGVNYAFLLGFVAGAFEIVPIAGPIFAAAVAILAALAESTKLAFFTLLVFIVIQQLENHLAVPLITKKLVGINPVVVILALMTGSAVGGVVGMILAIPSVVVLQEIVEDWGKRKGARLGA